MGIHLLGIGLGSSSLALTEAESSARSSSLLPSNANESSQNISSTYRHPILYNKSTGSSNMNALDQSVGLMRQRMSDLPLDHYQQQEQRVSGILAQQPAAQLTGRIGNLAENFLFQSSPDAINQIGPQLSSRFNQATQGSAQHLNVQQITTQAPVLTQTRQATEKESKPDQASIGNNNNNNNNINRLMPTNEVENSARIVHQQTAQPATNFQPQNTFYSPPILAYGSADPTQFQSMNGLNPQTIYGLPPYPMIQTPKEFPQVQMRFGELKSQEDSLALKRQQELERLPSSSQNQSQLISAQPLNHQLASINIVPVRNHNNHNNNLALKAIEGINLNRQPNLIRLNSPILSSSTNQSNQIRPKPQTNLSLRLPSCASQQKQNSNLTLTCQEDREYPTIEIMRALELYAAEHGTIELLIPQSLVWLYLNQHQAQSSAIQRSPLDSLQQTIAGQTQDEAPFPSASYDSLCTSSITMSQPRRAKNLMGQWKVVVNLPGYKYRGVAISQMLRAEECNNPMGDCNINSTSSDRQQSGVKSRCLQHYANHRLLAWSEQLGLHMDIFRIPSSCSCHISRQLS